MATKKKVEDESGESPEVMDEAPVDEATNDGEATGVEPEVESSTPVEASVEGTLIERAQGILGVRVTGKTDHSTKVALRRFQRENGLSPTGNLNFPTQSRLHL